MTKLTFKDPQLWRVNNCKQKHKKKSVRGISMSFEKFDSVEGHEIESTSLSL